MKNICFLIIACLIIGCSPYPDFDESQENGYIDYSTCQEELITSKDSFLLANVDFQEGKLVCLLDASSVAEKGIPKGKYDYFLEYLRKKNNEIEKSLNAGEIVIYNGKSFTRNEKLYQYIECSDRDMTRATEYDYVVLLCTRSHKIMPSNLDPPVADFYGPAKLIVRITGRGNFTVTESTKGFVVKYLNDLLASETTIKWGVGNYTHWSWYIKHSGPLFSVGTVDFYGHFEKKAPAPSPIDPIYWGWYNNLPPYIQIDRISDELLKICITKPGSYTVRTYYKDSPGQYRLFGEIRHYNGSERYINYPQDCSFWVVVYEEIERDGDISLEYVGDIEFRHPSLEGYPLD